MFHAFTCFVGARRDGDRVRAPPRSRGPVAARASAGADRAWSRRRARLSRIRRSGGGSAARLRNDARRPDCRRAMASARDRASVDDARLLRCFTALPAAGLRRAVRNRRVATRGTLPAALLDRPADAGRIRGAGRRGRCVPCRADRRSPCDRPRPAALGCRCGAGEARRQCPRSLRAKGSRLDRGDAGVGSRIHDRPRPRRPHWPAARHARSVCVQALPLGASRVPDRDSAAAQVTICGHRSFESR